MNVVMMLFQMVLQELDLRSNLDTFCGQVLNLVQDAIKGLFNNLRY